METVGRNALCPCGSGKKYKACCMSKAQSNFEGLPYGLRVKGGVGYDPGAGGFVVIVHIWDNIECRGEPKEWSYPQVYQSEDEAMHDYKTFIRPRLKRILEKKVEKSKAGVFIHHQLE